MVSVSDYIFKLIRCLNSQNTGCRIYDHDGLTLLELLITVNLIIVTSILAFINFGDSYNISLIKREAISIISLLESTRLKTINTAIRCKANFVNDQYNVSCLRQDESSVPNVRYYIKSNVHVCKNKEINLWEKGTGNGETLCLNRRGSQCFITISLKGRSSLKCI
jgi:hypothetical protein